MRQTGNGLARAPFRKFLSKGFARRDSLIRSTNIQTKGVNNAICKPSESNGIEQSSLQSWVVHASEYENNSEGIIRFVVSTAQQQLKDVNARIFSPVQSINKLQWKVMLQRKNSDLGIFLCLHGTEYDPNYKVYAEFSFKLVVKQENSSYSLQGSGQHEFRQGGTGHGFPHFAKVDKLLNPGGNCLRDGTIMIECHVACSLPLKVVKLKVTKDATIQTFMRANGFCVDYLADRARYILENDVGSDCEFVVDGLKVRKRASKAILARASPVFEQMFFKNGKGCNVYRVLDVSASVFDLLLRHIYGAGWEFQSKVQATQLFYAARKYDLKDLQMMCIQFIWPTTLEDTWIALDCAVRYELEDLQEAAMEILRKNASEVLKAEQFVNISFDCLELILKQTKLNVSSEIEVFDAALRWARAQCKKDVTRTGSNLRLLLRDTIKYIRFLSMTKEQFAGSPCESGVLTEQEKADILERLATKKKEPLFVELSGITSPREMV